MTISGDQNLVRTAGDVIKKYFDSTSKEAEVVEAKLLAAPTAEEEIENRVLASALGDSEGDVAAEEIETETEAALPAPASAAATKEVSEMVTEAEDMPG